MAEPAGWPIWQVVRVPTGVPNLDRVIDGGLTRGGFLLIVGGPGTGKTVLAEQMAFHWASQGLNTLWLVTLGEPNEKLLINLSEMCFFDRSQVGAAIQLVNLTRFLRQSFEEQLAAIRETLHSKAYSFVVIDGFQSFRCFLKDQREVRFFLSELSAELGLAGTTLIVTVDANPRLYWEAAEFSMADALIVLDRITVEGRERRQLQVLKLRGRPTIEGAHTFTIDRSGIHVHPRIESVLPRGAAAGDRTRHTLGVSGLDHLLGGGVLEGSSTLIAGGLGTGKSLLASHFLAAAIREGHPCLALSLFENAGRFLQRANSFGLPLQQASEAGLFQLSAYDPAHWDPDSCAEHIVQAVEERGIQRLVIDGIDAVESDLNLSGRTLNFLASLVEYLHLRRVTTVLTYELPDLFGQAVSFPRPVVGQVAANLILLRFAELEGRLRRLLTIIKTRYSEHRPVVAELLLADGELQIVRHPSEREGGAGDLAYGAEPRRHEGERFRV